MQSAPLKCRFRFFRCHGVLLTFRACDWGEENIKTLKRWKLWREKRDTFVSRIQIHRRIKLNCYDFRDMHFVHIGYWFETDAINYNQSMELFCLGRKKSRFSGRHFNSHNEMVEKFLRSFYGFYVVKILEEQITLNWRIFRYLREKSSSKRFVFSTQTIECSIKKSVLQALWYNFMAINRVVHCSFH